MTRAPTRKLPRTAAARDELDMAVALELGDRYQVERRERCGPLSCVYRARDLAAGQLVALKVLPHAWREGRGSGGGAGAARPPRGGGPLEPRACLRLVEQLAAALHYAHRRGVTHGNVKPANVMVASAGLALLSDFALARALEPDSPWTPP